MSLHQVITLHHVAAHIPWPLHRSPPVTRLATICQGTQQVSSGRADLHREQQLCTAAELPACGHAGLSLKPLSLRGNRCYSSLEEWINKCLAKGHIPSFKSVFSVQGHKKLLFLLIQIFRGVSILQFVSLSGRGFSSCLAKRCLRRFCCISAHDLRL